jgi:hypothetical protein
MSDVMNQEDELENQVLWTKEQEELLKDWCDIANCFRWMHEQSSFKYKRINNQIALPVIVLSTLTGTANFGMNSLIPQSAQKFASAIVGGINIFCGVLTTVQTYFKYAETSEAHGTASKLWSKLQRIIGIELAIERAKRKRPNEFLKYCIEEYNKLKETSPVIPSDIAHQFRIRFKRVHTVYKPDVYEHLGATLTYTDYLSRNANNGGGDNSRIRRASAVSTATATASERNHHRLSSITEDDENESVPMEEIIPTPPIPVKELAKKFSGVGEEINRRILLTRQSNNNISNINNNTTATNFNPINISSNQEEQEQLKPNIKSLADKLELSDILGRQVRNI